MISQLTITQGILMLVFLEDGFDDPVRLVRRTRFDLQAKHLKSQRAGHREIYRHVCKRKHRPSGFPGASGGILQTSRRFPLGFIGSLTMCQDHFDLTCFPLQCQKFPGPVAQQDCSNIHPSSKSSPPVAYRRALSCPLSSPRTIESQ